MCEFVVANVLLAISNKIFIKAIYLIGIVRVVISSSSIAGEVENKYIVIIEFGAYLLIDFILYIVLCGIEIQ